MGNGGIIILSNIKLNICGNVFSISGLLVYFDIPK